MGAQLPALAARAGPEGERAPEQHVLQCAARLPSPPDIVMELVKAVDSDNSSSAQVARLVERDPALTARVLKVSNSPFYGMAGRVGTIRDAVVILVFSNVCNLVVAIEIANRYGALPGLQAQLATFWRHGMLAALSASLLARRSGAEGGLAFTAGLLHDIGKLVLAQAYPDEAPLAPLQAGRALPESLAAERERFGMDHAELGGWIAERWRFPPSIAGALRAHHDDDTQDSLARLICEADRVAHAIAEPGASGDALQACADALVALDSDDTAPDLLTELERQAGAASEVFQGKR